MANEDLRMQLSELETRYNILRQQNAELEAQCNESRAAMIRADQQLHEGMGEVQQRLGGATNALGRAHQRIVDASAVQSQMDAIYRDLKQMELANKRIRECNNKKYYDFATYRTVRKIVQGVMDNLDFSMIPETTIEKAVERSELDKPCFWLTAALMAVVAWRADQRERAERALSRALRLDERKTASFFMIFYIRLHREPTAIKWFELLSRQPLKGSDRMIVLLFFSMLTHTLEEDISDSTRRTLNAYINRLFDEAMHGSESVRAAAVDRICNAYQEFIAQEERRFDYDALKRFVPSKDGLVEALAGARGTADIIDFIVDTLTVDERHRNEFLKYYIDEVVAEPCAAEQDVYDEIERDELIIRYHGDVDQATAAFKQRKKMNEDDLDIISAMIDWIFVPSKQGETNPQMRKSMLVLSKPLQQQAAQQYIDRYRARLTPRQHLTIRDFSADTDLSNPAMMKQQAQDHYRQVAASQKQQVKDGGPIVLISLGIVAAVTLGIFVNPFLAIAGGLVAVSGAIWLVANVGRRKRIDERCAADLSSTQADIDTVAVEWQRFAEDFHQEDIRSQQMLDTITSMSA